MKYLSDLNRDEKQLLRQRIACPDYTMELPVNNGVTVKLQNFFVISPASSTHLMNGVDMRIPFFVQLWVVKMVRENSDIGI